MNWSKVFSMGGGVITIAAAIFLALTGQIQWDAAIGIAASGAGILGLHVAVHPSSTNS